jgi:hypothetical protein
MEGGEISNNVSGNRAGQSAGVFLITNSNSTFIMRGGRIIDNYNVYNPSSLSDVSLYVGGNSIIISGNAIIGSLNLNGNDTDNSIISIAGSYTGNVEALNLHFDANTDIEEIINLWENKSIIIPTDTYTLTANDISKIALGSFLAGINTQFNGLILT